MRFEVEETHTVCDGLVIRWKSKRWANYPEISASRKGVLIGGAWPVMSGESIAHVIGLLCDASRVHLQLEAGNYVEGSAAAVYATTHEGAPGQASAIPPKGGE